VTWAGIAWEREHSAKQFAAQQRASHRGYVFGYQKQAHRAFLIWPNSRRDGVNLNELTYLQILRTSPEDNGNFSDYWLRLATEDEDLGIPYFAVDAKQVLRELASDIPNFDTERAIKKMREFEHGKFEYCMLWSASGLPGAGEARNDLGRPEYRYCDP
jgi:hypothetical protein